MAAMRLALMRLRCFGSSTAASMGARGLETQQVIGPAAPRVPLLPSLRRTVTRNVEGLRHFSTEGMEEVGQNKSLLMKHKAKRFLCMWWQRSKETLENDIKRRHSILFYSGCAALICYEVSVARTIHLGTLKSTDTSVSHSGVGPKYSVIPTFGGLYLFVPKFTHNKRTIGKPVRCAGEGPKSTNA